MSNFLLVSGDINRLARWRTLRMPNSLPLPSELQILLEKRDDDRREADRRQQDVPVENEQRGRAPRRQRKRRTEDRNS